jgi:hypothetical protein
MQINRNLIASFGFNYQSYEDFSAQAQDIFDWVKDNHDKWHVELREIEGRTAKVWVGRPTR